MEENQHLLYIACKACKDNFVIPTQVFAAAKSELMFFVEKEAIISKLPKLE